LSAGRALLVGLLAVLTAGAQPPRPRPAWTHDGIVMAGNWEPLTFLRRRGGQTAASLEDWKLERTAAVARQLKDAGVNLVVTNFHKGFGLQAEAEDIEAARRFVEYAHRQGLRVGGYIGASMMAETFFAEEPQAPDWRQVDERGQPIFYLDAGQTFRFMACRNHPGYHGFLDKLIHLGVETMKFDLLHFDQMESWTEPNVCRCRYCRAQFREFLRAKYTAAGLRARFGFARLDDVEPPPMAPLIAAGAGEVVNPLMQDWVEFRAAGYAQRYGEYDALLGRLNPQVALAGNPNLDLALNKATRNAADPARLLQHGDFVWSEEPQQASWTADGRLVSKIRSYKLVRRMGQSLFTYTGGRYGTANPESPAHLRLAEAMAYNDMNLGMVGDVTPQGIALTPEARRYIAFFHAHRSVLRGTRALADVAVLRSFASVEFNPAAGLVGATLFEQSLIQARVPFDIVLDSDLPGLDRYQVLVVANQDALSDAQVAAIARFVERGGGLVVTGDSSVLTEWRLRRRRAGLAELAGRDLPSAVPLRREAGRGRVAYIPRIVPAVEPPEPRINYRFDSRCWKLAVNHRELLEAVEWAARGNLRVRVEAPPSVTMEFAGQAATDTLLLHLVNFDFRHPVRNAAVTVALPAGMALQAIAVESPDRDGRETLAGKVERGQIRFQVPHLDTYSLITIQLQRI
jgi:hypothetical protein